MPTRSRETAIAAPGWARLFLSGMLLGALTVCPAMGQQMDPEAVPPEATLPAAGAPQAVQSTAVNANGRPNYPAEVQGTSRFRGPAPRDLANQLRLAPGQAAQAPQAPAAGSQAYTGQGGQPRPGSLQMETMPGADSNQMRPGATSQMHPLPAPQTAGPTPANADKDCPGCKHHREIQTDPLNSTSANAYPMSGQGQTQVDTQTEYIEAGQYGKEGKSQYPGAQSSQPPAPYQTQSNQYGQGMVPIPQGQGQGQYGATARPNTPDPLAVIETSKGTITIRLFRGLAPRTVANFIELCQKGFYNGLSFHRVEPGFVIQTGCPIGDGTGSYIDPATNRPRYIALELNPRLRHNAAGVVAMARFGSNPNSASSQFYITLGAHANLDNKYAIFGGVVGGLDVVNAISKSDRIITIAVQEQEQPQ